MSVLRNRSDVFQRELQLAHGVRCYGSACSHVTFVLVKFRLKAIKMSTKLQHYKIHQSSCQGHAQHFSEAFKRLSMQCPGLYFFVRRTRNEMKYSRKPKIKTLGTVADMVLFTGKSTTITKIPRFVHPIENSSDCASVPLFHQRTRHTVFSP